MPGRRLEAEDSSIFWYAWNTTPVVIRFPALYNRHAFCSGRIEVWPCRPAEQVATEDPEPRKKQA
jgi:hypothetical protein